MRNKKAALIGLGIGAAVAAYVVRRRRTSSRG